MKVSLRLVGDAFLHVERLDAMDYFDYTYKHNYIEFSSSIYKVGTYNYNWHGGTEIFILLKGRVEMSCNDETLQWNLLMLSLFRLRWDIQL